MVDFVTVMSKSKIVNRLFVTDVIYLVDWFKLLIVCRLLPQPITMKLQVIVISILILLVVCSLFELIADILFVRFT